MGVARSEVVAEFVAGDPGRLIGMMGLDPNDKDMLEQLERGRTALGEHQFVQRETRGRWHVDQDALGAERVERVDPGRADVVVPAAVDGESGVDTAPGQPGDGISL